MKIHETHVNGIKSVDNHPITTGIPVVNRVSIEIDADTADATYIWSCLSRWREDGKIKLKFNCTDQEAFMMGLVDPE